MNVSKSARDTAPSEDSCFSIKVKMTLIKIQKWNNRSLVVDKDDFLFGLKYFE